MGREMAPVGYNSSALFFGTVSQARCRTVWRDQLKRSQTRRSFRPVTTSPSCPSAPTLTSFPLFQPVLLAEAWITRLDRRGR